MQANFSNHTRVPEPNVMQSLSEMIGDQLGYIMMYNPITPPRCGFQLMPRLKSAYEIEMIIHLTVYYWLEHRKTKSQCYTEMPQTRCEQSRESHTQFGSIRV